MKYFVTFITALLLSTNALASSYSTLSLGTSYFYEDNPSYSTDFELKPTLAFSHFVEVNKEHNIVAGFSTNRVDNFIAGRRQYTIKFKSGARGVNDQRVTFDAALVGKRYNRWLSMFFVANAKVDNKFTSGSFVKKEIKHTFLYGVNVSYLLNEELSISVAVIAPNDELHLRSGFNVSMGVNF